MGSQVEEQDVLRRYLLGDLPAESQRSLEERLMTDGGLYEELLMAEDDLVDQYLAGTLAARAREAFERSFLATPERRHKLSFAAALRKYVATAERPQQRRPETEKSGPSTHARGRLLRGLFRPARPAVGWALAAALLLAAATAAFVAVRSWRAGGPELAARVFIAELKPGAVRQAGEEMRRVAPPADASVVRLELQWPSGVGLETPPGGGQGFRAVLLADDGRALLSRDGLEAREKGGARYVTFDVPAGLLTRGDYRVKLSRLADGGATPEDVASYSFRVAR